MGPVSFSRLSFADRSEALDAARRLTAVGIRVQSTDDLSILVRGDDYAAAKRLLAGRERASPRTVQPLKKPFDANVPLPGSKSHTNRALLCAALADGRSTLSRVLLADDTRAMLGALDRLGVGLRVDDERDPDVVVTVDGLGEGFTAEGDTLTLDVMQSGTTSRFLVPALAAGRGSFVVDGHEQLRNRPFVQQVEALTALGARIDGTALPLTIHGRRLRGGLVTVPGDVSSQFLSGLLLAAPLFAADTVVEVDGALVSRPYVELTIHTMATFGIDVAHDFEAGRFAIPATGYRPASVDLEPDASAASYFFAAAAITGSTVRVDGLGKSTVQGDLGFVELLARMGARVEVAEDHTTVTGTGRLVGITVDMADISDTAQTMAVVAACAEGPTEITGIGFIRHKETDRIAAPVTELQRLGIRAESTDDGFIVHPGPVTGGLVDTYDDHRMAMSFALLGLVHPGVVIDNPGCVDKTFPRFFEVLDSLRAS
ncbi:MAG: 3-phosphoshikimate 1-carboxyvinyltransferase [Acidimicrobiia bacterium]|nr:3-phosphoshikimate 1-carboxyvinyltransferase [Acidimicrobiia bacterium]